MTNKNGKSGVNTFGAAVAGAALGAAAVTLAKKENREKLREKWDKVMEKGQTTMDNAKEATDEAKVKGRKKIARELDKAEKKLAA